MDHSVHKSDLVQVKGINLHYLDWGGDGNVLLFLAGLGCNAHIFDHLAPRFTDQFHVMALTRRGHGESDHPETGYDVDTLTDDIRCFLDAQLGGDVIVLMEDDVQTGLIASAVFDTEEADCGCEGEESERERRIARLAGHQPLPTQEEIRARTARLAAHLV